MIIKSLTINTQVGEFERTEMIIKSLTINTQVGGKINRPGQLEPRFRDQEYETKRQGKQLNLTCILTVIDATSYSDSLKQVH